jgi:carboxymethylenebutenolidase
MYDLMITLSTGTAALRVAQGGGVARGGLIVAQEIFGLNANIRALCRRFADDGFEVIAPAYFNHIEPGFTAGYDPDGIQRGLSAVRATPWDRVVADTQAAVDTLRAAGNARVYVTGFCWGGTVAWLAACRVEGVTAASGFYGRLINTLLDEAPKVPIELHYGDADPGIPLSMVDEVRTAHPDVPIHVYPAGHGFFSDRGHDHDPAQADVAWARTLALFDRCGLGAT